MWKSENVLLTETGSQHYGSLNFLLQSTLEMTLAYQKPINILQQVWIAYVLHNDNQNYIWHYSKETLVCLMLRTFHNGHPSPKVEKLYDSFSVQVFIFCHIIDAYCSFPINPSIYNILRWVAWTMGQMAHWRSVWHSKYFSFIISYRHRTLKTLYFHFCSFIKKKMKKINWKDFCKEFCKKLWKKPRSKVLQF